MKIQSWVLAASMFVTACGVSDARIGGGDEYGETEGALGAPLAEVHCTGTPDTGSAGRWRHLKSYLIAGLGEARHRGVDLVASSSDSSQVIRGEATYGVNDKALEDEWVQLYACRSGSWSYLGPVLTDGEGRFSLTLTGSARLPSGVRDLFVSVFGDRTSARFTAVVAPAGTQVVVSDIDGTLTSAENAFPESLVGLGNVAAQPNAPAALATLRDHGYAIVYITARGRYFTPETRAWLSAKGFPAGALRLAPSLVTLPGQPTVDYKAGAMRALALPVTVGIGNRSTDVQAYQAVGVAGARTFVKLPEYSSELQGALSSGAAVGFTDYGALVPVFAGF